MNVVTTSRLLAGICMLAIAAPAMAQDPAMPATPAPSEPAPAQAAEAPAAPAPSVDSADPAAAAAAAASAARRELPQTLPTTGDGADVTRLLTNVCKPMVKGGNFDALAKANKLKLDRKTGEYVTPLSGSKDYRVGIYPPGINKTTCQMNLRYAVGGDQELVDSLNIWRFLHEPQMVLRRNDGANYADVQRITTTWDNYANQMIDGQMYGLAIVQINQRDGTKNVNPKYDEATIQYSVRAPVQPIYEGPPLGSAPAEAPAAAPTDGTAPAPAAPVDAAAPATPPAPPAGS